MNKTLLLTIRDVIILIAVLGLILPFPSYGKSNVPQEEGNHPAQGDEHRTSPCSHPRPLGKAKRLDRQCLPPGSSGGVAKGDFNGDGFGDLAVGIPFEDIGDLKDAGAVNVIYGSANGLTATDPTVPASQFWSLDSPGVPGTPHSFDVFGWALAAGDFNGDGFSDLAVGILDRGDTRFGEVIVIYGSAKGLTATDPTVPASQFWFPFQFSDPATVAGARFGTSLVWADFNGDGVGDLGSSIQ